MVNVGNYTPRALWLRCLSHLLVTKEIFQKKIKYKFAYHITFMDVWLMILSNQYILLCSYCPANDVLNILRRLTFTVQKKCTNNIKMKNGLITNHSFYTIRFFKSHSRSVEVIITKNILMREETKKRFLILKTENIFFKKSEYTVCFFTSIV